MKRRACQAFLPLFLRKNTINCVSVPGLSIILRVIAGEAVCAVIISHLLAEKLVALAVPPAALGGIIHGVHHAVGHKGLEGFHLLVGNRCLPTYPQALKIGKPVDGADVGKSVEPGDIQVLKRKLEEKLHSFVAH